jgi:hypothetical protein
MGVRKLAILSAAAMLAISRISLGGVPTISN